MEALVIPSSSDSYSVEYDRALVFMFFMEFSRFEYAMKRSGFLKPGTRSARPDWQALAESLTGRLLHTSHEPFEIGVRELCRRPPRQQIVLPDGTLGWKELQRNSEDTFEAYVIQLMKTVRNNLFHGGKFPHPEGSLSDIIEDRVLIESALEVLRMVRHLVPSIDAYFREAA